MKILVDMNLSPRWVTALQAAGIEARHWSTVGAPNAPDEDVLSWTAANGFVLLTNDLDFGAILASSEANIPSVIQIRTQDLRPGTPRVGFAVRARKPCRARTRLRYVLCQRLCSTRPSGARRRSCDRKDRPSDAFCGCGHCGKVTTRKADQLAAGSLSGNCHRCRHWVGEGRRRTNTDAAAGLVSALRTTECGGW